VSVSLPHLRGICGPDPAAIKGCSGKQQGRCSALYGVCSAMHRLAAQTLPYPPAALHRRRALAHPFHGGFRRRNLVS